MKAGEAEVFTYLRWQQQTDPPYYVNSTAISADGQRVLAGTFFHSYSPQMDALPPTPSLPDQFGTYCFDSEGRQLWVDKFQGFEGVYTVAISASGKIAASGGWITSSPYDGFVRAYEVDNGPANILDFRTQQARVNALALSADGSTLVAAADKIYLFQQTNGVFPVSPAEFPLQSPPAGSSKQNSVQAIAVTTNGTWIVAGDYFGNIYLIENDAGTFGKSYVWNDSALPTIHSVALTPDGQWFAVGGSGSTVYVFNFESMTASSPTYAGTYTLDTGGRVGWVAISDDGTFLSAIGNKGQAGAVVAIKNDNGTLTKVWEQPTAHNPNSTSVDSSANFVCVADGYPDGQPGSFSLFDGSCGSLLWSYPTDNMNWPMFISADGSGIAAGSDNGNVFYFTPRDASVERE